MTRSRAALAAATLTLAVALSGCVMAVPAPAKTAAQRPPADGGTYPTVVALKDAYVKAGGACANWVEDDIIKSAAQSGHCSDADAFSIYLSSADTQDAAMAVKTITSGLVDTTLLVGKNWIINGEAAISVADKLGGTVVTSK